MEHPPEAAPAANPEPPAPEPSAAPELVLHASASLFPPLRETEFEALVADIREKGQLEAIWTYQGKVIDGRHRLLACRRLGLVPRTREWDGNGSLLEFIVSANLRRRHLKENQRAMVAARMLPHFEAEALKRKQHRPEGELSPNLDQGRSMENAGKALNVSKNSVYSARKILDRGTPELIARVDQGTLAVSLAAKVAELPDDEQTRLVMLKRSEIAQDIRARRPARPAKPKTDAELEEEQAIARLIQDTQIGRARLKNTPQGLRLELPPGDCLTEFYRLNRDHLHLIGLLKRGVFIVINEAV